MKIISLEAENYKRLKAVEITPEGNTVVIAGRNAQGKSSVLDAIWAALGGREGNKASKPIRDGEAKARVKLDLGDMVVTRTWSGDSSTVKVESADGATFKSPQALLDGLVGKLSFDPLAFTRLSPKDQRQALLALVELDVDLDALAAERLAAYDRRTAVGRDGKAFGDVTVDDSLPTAEQSASELIAQIREAESAASEATNRARDVATAASIVANLKAQLESAEANLAEAKKADAAHFVPDVSVDELTAKLAAVEDTNAAIRANNTAREAKARQDALREKYKELSDRIDALDKTQADALATAKFPVDGLGFDDSGVTFQGVPFAQASSAEQIRVSLAMAIAANPKLRVVRIMDGSLLDDDSMKIIAAVAAENDMQVWIERVGDAGGMGVVIEDGEVADA